jgi:glycosyltransferase involved in cell wall biosynthesis
VFFGDGTNERGLFTLLCAIPKITSELPETHFTIAIRHWQKSLRDSALHAINKSVTTLLEYPHFSNMLKLVSSADVVALPFLVNSMEPPLSLIESLAMAKPVVTSDIGGNREIIGNNERGVLIKPNNATELSNAIITLLSDEHECLNRGNFARLFITERYNWEKAISTLNEIYNHVQQQE